MPLLLFYPHVKQRATELIGFDLAANAKRWEPIEAPRCMPRFRWCQHSLQEISSSATTQSRC